MKRLALLLTVALSTAVFLTVEVGTAAAEPAKNQITVTTEPCGPNDETYTFVINAMSKTGHILDSTGNVVVKRYTVTYFDANDLTKVLGTATFGRGVKTGLEDDLITCTGATEPISLKGFSGEVIAEFVFQAFLTPQGK